MKESEQIDVELLTVVLDNNPQEKVFISFFLSLDKDICNHFLIAYFAYIVHLENGLLDPLRFGNVPFASVFKQIKKSKITPLIVKKLKQEALLSNDFHLYKEKVLNSMLKI